MKVIVINLDRAIERMAFQKKQLDELDIDFTRLSANCSSHQIAYERYKNCWERTMSFSEISLFFNHKKIWDMIIEENKPILILEDDAYLAQTTAKLLTEIEKLKNIDYLNIEARGNNQKKLLAKSADFSLNETFLYRLYQGRSGAGGYVLWPSGAKKLLMQFSTGKLGIVDKFINANYALKSYQADPAILIQLDKCEHYGLPVPIETISYNDRNFRAPTKSVEYWVHKLGRIKGQLKIGFNQIMHLHHSIKRAVRISDQFKVY